jgi:hypothetical protein
MAFRFNQGINPPMGSWPIDSSLPQGDRRTTSLAFKIQTLINNDLAKYIRHFV